MKQQTPDDAHARTDNCDRPASPPSRRSRARQKWRDLDPERKGNLLVLFWQVVELLLEPI